MLDSVIFPVTIRLSPFLPSESHRFREQRGNCRLLCERTYRYDSRSDGSDCTTFAMRDRLIPTGTKRDILRLLAREPLDPTSLAQRLQIGESQVYEHLASLQRLGYVERVSDAGGYRERPDLYAVGPAARGTVPKRHDLVLGAILEALISYYGPDDMTDLLGETATRLARSMNRQSETLPVDWHYEKALTWIENELAWKATVTAEGDDYLLVAIQGCLFHELTQLPEGACAGFFTELLGSLCHTHVQPVPVKGSIACCKLKLFRDASMMRGRDG